ncbi:hypothetical protein VP01_1459g2 [Puccinia sorghi]|uniref:Nucleolar pre-ribosomal-associated protein 1 C-terminal domain-containing protein n=1 Tax=Puccinia sorghi TaxID=27349 RepID=A0A0L6VJV9_9BASI|nr:hypothetical protein VP01_1459g2 [Puccinia sorghi]
MAHAFNSGAQVIAGLKAQEPAKIGSGGLNSTVSLVFGQEVDLTLHRPHDLALVQLRQLCSTKPIPAVVLDYLQLEPAADSIFQVLNVAREANSIHLLANSLYTLSYLISRSPTSPFETRHAVDGSRIITHLVQNHSKSIHRCFAPGRTEATLACLTLLISCVCWNEGACAKIVISELRWDQKTVARLLQTRQTVTSPQGDPLPNQKGNRSATKSSKLKGHLHNVDIRTLMLRLIFSVVSNAELRSSSKQELWKTKGLAEGVLKGLSLDPYETVAFVLGNLWENLKSRHTSNAGNHNHNAFIHHSGWDMFDRNAITTLVQLLERDDSVKDIQTTKLDSAETVANMVERFLTQLAIYLASSVSTDLFQHQANSRLPSYHILLNLIKFLSPTKSMRRWRLTLQILESVPSLCFSLWRTASPPSEPSTSIAWMSSVGFATKVASMPFMLSLGATTCSPMSDNVNNLTSTAKNLLAQCIPTPLNRAWFTKALQHSDALVSFSSLVLLLTGLKKARNISYQLKAAVHSTTLDHSGTTSDLWSKLLLAFQQSLQATLPDSQVLIAILRTASRRENEQTGASVDPPEASMDESQSNAAATIQQENDTSGNIVSFCALAVLLMYHGLIPQTMCNVNFDYTKLIPTFFKLNLNEEFNESQSGSLVAIHQLLSPIAYLCQSRTLLLVGHSALTNPTQPSPALVKVLLLLSSFPTLDAYTDCDLGAHTPLLIKDIAQETLQSICKSIVPHLRDDKEYEELCIWISALSELRRIGDCVTPLIFFLEDCLRACLRHPLKYLQISEERRRSPQSGSNLRPTTLTSALLVKVKAITKGASTSSTNPSRVALISLVIKFLNLYLFMLLSTSHRTRPITIVHDISSQLGDIFSMALGNPVETPSTYPYYFGDTIIKVLRSATQKLTFTEASYQKSITWPSYLTESIFSSQVAALNSMYASFCAMTKAEKPSKKSVTFMNPSSITTSTSLGETVRQSRNHRLAFIQFMTRAVEVEESTFTDSSHQLPNGSLGNVEQLDYEAKASNIKVLVGLISKSIIDRPFEVECFLEEMLHFSQSVVGKRDFELLLDILRASCAGLEKPNHEKIKVLIRYSDLIIDSASYSLKIAFLLELTIEKTADSLFQCVDYLFPLIGATQQTKLLVALFSSMNPGLLDNIHINLIVKLVNLTAGLPPHEQHNLLDQLSVDPIIQVLCALSNMRNCNVATDLLLEIIERYPDPSTHPADKPQPWSTYCLEVLGACSPEQPDYGTKLRITSYFTRKDQNIASAAVAWLSKTPIDQLKLVWDGAVCLLVACLEALPPDKSCSSSLLPLGKHRLDELIITIGSCLFPVYPQTSASALPDRRETRLLAFQALQLLQTSAESCVGQLLADQIQQTGVIPAYSQALDFLSTCKSSHVSAYIDRCFCWLVRRFAEDESCSEDTVELVESLHKFLRQQPAEYTLSSHLVNPVLTAALDRLIDSGCVMQLMDLVVRHTKLGEVNVLKHVRATVESRNFRSLMRSSHQDQGKQDALVMSVINQLVMSYPIVAIQASLSKTLIPFYGGTMSRKDRLIFQIFRIEDLWSQTSEMNEVVLAWQPIIGNRVATNKPLDLVALLDSKMVEATSVWVLSRRDPDRLSSFPEYYDPSFLLALLLRMIQQEETLTISTWHSIARSGLLGLAMCALSSANTAWRFLGDRCLSKSYERLKVLDHTDASEILLPLEHFRYLHVANEETGKIMNIPPLITLFLSRCLSLFCTAPESALHQPLSKFLLQRAVIDAKDVPMLYSLLYSSADIPSEGHIWLMQMLQDGLCTTVDWKIMNHRQTFEILITLVHSSNRRTAPKLRHILLKVRSQSSSYFELMRRLINLLRKAVSHNQACIKLISKPGVMKVLEQLKPCSRREWKGVIEILQEVASRLPLFHKAISRECVEDIIQLLSHFKSRIHSFSIQSDRWRSFSFTDSFVNFLFFLLASLVASLLVVLRSLLISASFWMGEFHAQIIHDQRESDRLILLKFNHLCLSLSASNQSNFSLPHKNLILEIRARISYLLQL